MDKDILQITESINKETGLALVNVPSMNILRNQLAAYINELILNDFDKLVFILYRIDINEKAIKQLLQQATTVSAGETIADAIIARESEKIALRKKHTTYSDKDCNEEKW